MKYRLNCFEIRYDFRWISSISNFDTIVHIDTVFYVFRYVRNFRFDMHVLTVHVHHFLYYKLCRAVDIFQNLCRANAIRAVNIFLSKSETARNTRTADDFSLFLIFEQLTRKNIIARMVLSKNKIVSSRFFEQSNFKQMIMTQYLH